MSYFMGYSANVGLHWVCVAVTLGLLRKGFALLSTDSLYQPQLSLSGCFLIPVSWWRTITQILIFLMQWPVLTLGSLLFLILPSTNLETFLLLLGHCRLLGWPLEAGPAPAWVLGPVWWSCRVGAWRGSFRGEWLHLCVTLKPAHNSAKGTNSSPKWSALPRRNKRSLLSLPASPCCRAWPSVGVRKTRVQSLGGTPLRSA